MRQALARLAASAPVPVFPVVGGGAEEAVSYLRCLPAVEVVPTPRHAILLLVAGAFPPGQVRGLAQVHDTLPSPRATVRWQGEARGELAHAQTVTGDIEELAAALAEKGRRLLASEEESEPPLLPDVDPVEWRGVGPYGHGGKGMTGGTPYGRPLAEIGPDRDGLQLDRIPVTVGPWSGTLPPGLELGVLLAGDLVQEVQLLPPVTAPAAPDLFQRSLHEPVPVRSLELARARHHLRWLGEALTVGGLEALGRRSLRLARRLSVDSPVDDLLARVSRSGLARLALRGVGRTLPDRVEGLGPVARAAGVAEDARLADAAYRALRFQPVVGTGGDAAARWSQRLAEIRQSLSLVREAGERTAFGSGTSESPRGRISIDRPAVTSAGIIPELAAGTEWGDMVATVWSLDPDPAVGVSEEAPA